VLGECRLGLWRRLSFLPYRIRYGFWPDELWNLDVTMAKFIGPRLRGLQRSKPGCPNDYAEEFGDDCFDRWREDVGKMARAMEIISAASFAEHLDPNISAEIEVGLALFGKYFQALWD